MPAQAAIYLPHASPDLGKAFPGVRSDKGFFRKPTWFEFVLAGDVVRFTAMPGAGLAAHLRGFQGYVAAQPNDESAKRTASEMIGRTGTVLGLVTQAEFEDNADIRKTLLAIARAFDGFVFVQDSVVLPDGRALVGPLAMAVARGDAADEDFEHIDEEPVPPTPQRVAARALVLAAVSCRAFLEIEVDPKDPEEEAFRQRLPRWLHDVGAASELEPHEAKLLDTPLGQLDERSKIDACWRCEGLGVLAWALGRYELPSHDQTVSPGDLAANLGFLNDRARELLAAPALRSQEELDACRATYLTAHWRLRQFGLDRQPIDFAEFVARAWFGPLSLESLRLVNQDLAIGEVAIGDATPDLVQHCNSIATERHRATNWLQGYEPVYSLVDTST